MKIVRAEIDHLHLTAEVFNQYRVFYEQKDDIESCREFLGERLSLIHI